MDCPLRQIAVNFFGMKKIYLDYAASTPVAPEVLRATEPYFTEKFGNPGSLHSFGQEAIKAIDESREIIAKAIGTKFNEIIFTGSATEANNLALRGVVKKLGSKIKNPRIIVSTIEHESVLETVRDLERDGVEVIYLPVDSGGIVNAEALKKVLNERTVLVSVMYANNEIGTIQPIAEIAKIVKEFREESRSKNKESSTIHDPRFMFPFLHTDAAQAFQFLDCDVDKLGVDLLTISGHKIYGPKGIGALYVRNVLNVVNDGANGYNTRARASDQAVTTLLPIVTGGGQEFGMRSGTENVPLIVGFAKAAELVAHSRELENKRIAKLRDYFWTELKNIYPKAELNGFLESRSKNKESGMIHDSRFMLPNILNIYFPDHEAQFLLTKLDLAGVAASSGSACRSRAVETSHVIGALGYSRERAKRSVRFSFGRPTTEKEIKEALKILKDCFAN